MDDRLKFIEKLNSIVEPNEQMDFQHEYKSGTGMFEQNQETKELFINNDIWNHIKFRLNHTFSYQTEKLILKWINEIEIFKDCKIETIN